MVKKKIDGKRKTEIKKTVFLVFSLFVSMLFFFSPYSHALENLVVNPGFESGIGSPWGTNSTVRCTLDTTVSHSGNNSLRIAIPSPQTQNIYMGQAFGVEAGASYNLEVWIRSESVTGIGAHVSIEWNGGGNWWAPKVTGTRDWTKIQLSHVTIPDGITVARVLVYLKAGSTGTAWFDDVKVEREVGNLLTTFLLRPNYRGKIFPDASSPEIGAEIRLAPEDYAFSLDELEVGIALKDTNAGVAAQQRLTTLSADTFLLDLDIPDDLSAGPYNLQIGVYQKASGGLLTEQSYFMDKVSADEFGQLASYIDKDNRLIVNGEPFFPLGLYVAQCPNKPGHLSQLDEIAASPFDTLMNYCVHKCDALGDVTDEEITHYLELLNDRDLKLIFSLREFIGHGQADIDGITHMINTFGDDPAIISWYTNDELDLSYLPELEVRYELVKELDDNHPVWSVHWQKDVLIGEAHTTDVLGVDPYPVPNNPITMVRDWAEWAKDAGRGTRPLWLVPQIFERLGRAPTKEEMRAMTYLAVNHGAKGLIYYSYFNLLEDEFTPVPSAPQWAEIKDIAGEIRSLKQVFLSVQGTNASDLVCNVTGIDMKLMKEGNMYYLFSVNTLQADIDEVDFSVGLGIVPCAVDVLFEDGRQVAVDGGKFSDSFGPYEVHVYRWEDACCPGDFDCNGDIDGGELQNFADDFSKTDCMEPACVGDIDGDGDADGLDLAVFSRAFEPSM